jgi:hypothetical protein
MLFAAPRPRVRLLVLVSLSFAVTTPAAALARKWTHGWKPAVRTTPVEKAPDPTADADPGPASSATPNQHGKLVLFPFRDDDDDLSGQVERLLRAHGLEVMTGVRPVDSAEQYRDMATQLMLAGYVEGSVRGEGARAKVTVRLRSGYSGRIVAQPTFGDSHGNLRHELGEKLWKRLGPAVTRACKEASKPRKKSRTMLTIDAGTPLENTPRDQASESRTTTAARTTTTASRTTTASATPKPKTSPTPATAWVDPFAQ